jgi:ABC-2 type transport system ATP-binding protein
MMARGRIVADGTPAEVKAVVSGRRIRATARFAATPESQAALAALPGVRAADRRGDRVTLVSDDSDATLRALLTEHDIHDIHDIEVTAHTMDEAFLALTETRATEGALS